MALFYPNVCELNESFFMTNSKTESRNQSFSNFRHQSKEIGHSGHGFAKITIIKIFPNLSDIFNNFFHFFLNKLSLIY